MKKCFKCDAEKELSEFYDHPQMADKHLNICKECVKERGRKRNFDDAEKVLISRVKTCEKTGNKMHARRAVDEAIRAGVLSKPQDCSVCGEIKPSRILQAHHHDYKKPLEVIFVCAKCHAELHPEKWQRVACPKCRRMICKSQMNRHQKSKACFGVEH